VFCAFWLAAHAVFAGQLWQRRRASATRHGWHALKSSAAAKKHDDISEQPLYNYRVAGHTGQIMAGANRQQCRI